jgi:hypothetical protein
MKEHEMNATMTITDTDWSTEGITECWMDDEPREVAEDAAQTEIAWLINNLHTKLPGWTYDPRTGTFAGPVRTDAVSVVMGLVVEAGDFAVEHLDEIRADAA